MSPPGTPAPRQPQRARSEPLAIEPLGDGGWLLRLGTRIDAACNARVHALAAALADGAPAAVEDIVPAHASLAVLHRAGDGAARAAVRAWIDAVLAGDATPATMPAPPPPEDASRSIDIHVHYDGEDLATVAAHAGLSIEEVVARHVAPLYTVAMIGFAPGFPYLLGLDPRLSMPRLPTPRPLVPAGSVAIAELQTGIYPQAGPGGWRLLGRTDARLFDATRGEPALLRAGDRVRLHAA